MLTMWIQNNVPTLRVYQTKNLKSLQTIFLKSLVRTLVISLLILIETKKVKKMVMNQEMKN